MSNYTFPLTEAQQIWEQLPGVTSHVKMLPGDILQLWAQIPAASIRKMAIPHWSEFEHGELDFTADDFADWMGIAAVHDTQQLILITDEGWKDKVAFRFMAGDFGKFVDWYASHYEMDFLQSADYILFQEDLTLVNILHHDGMLFTCHRDLPKAN